MKVLKAIGRWMKEHVWETVAAFGAGLAVIFGLAFLVQRRATQKARDEGRIAMVKGMVKELQARSQALEEQDLKDEAVVEELGKEREVLRQEVETARDIAGMTDDEALDAFASLGY